jgi:hypothetical protein
MISDLSPKIGGKMADLEQHALRRDRRFVVRLILALALAFIGGLYVYGHLTSSRTAGCASDLMLGS